MSACFGDQLPVLCFLVCRSFVLFENIKIKYKKKKEKEKEKFSQVLPESEVRIKTRRSIRQGKLEQG